MNHKEKRRLKKLHQARKSNRPRWAYKGDPYYTERNRILRTLGFKSYGDYLSSSTWHNIRAAVMNRDKWVCRLCLRRTATQAHHTEYDLDTLSGQIIDNVVAVCSTCHVKIEYDKHPTLPRKHPFAVVRGNTLAWLRRNAAIAS